MQATVSKHSKVATFDSHSKFHGNVKGVPLLRSLTMMHELWWVVVNELHRRSLQFLVQETTLEA